MKRRNFIRSLSSSMIALPITINNLSIGVLPQELSLFSSIMDSDRVLVLVRLNGGNDGLNTLVPLDQYDRLYRLRQNVIIPEDSLLKISDTNGFHPNMLRFHGMYEKGKVGIVQSVGYPNQNRSHFRSTDIWTSGSSSEEKVTSGWMGRYLQNRHPEFPENYPNGSYPDPLAITIGNNVSHTCQGSFSNFSMAVVNPFNLSPLSVGQEGELPDNYYGRNISYLNTAIAQTNAYSAVIEQAANRGNNLARYADNNWLAYQLQVVARLISGGINTKIFIVSQGGYDTHSGQVVNDRPLLGAHSNLLLNLSSAIASFQQDLELLGLDDRVIGMTFSEFGRRIRSNGSIGTDHGDAAPMFLFGKCVNPAILGHNPVIPANVNNRAGVPMQYDFRSIYGSVLEDWFGVEKQEIKDLLYEDYQHQNLITCGQFVEPAGLTDAFNYPNPFNESTIFAFESQNENVQISLLDSMGREVAQVLNKTLREGMHRIPYTPKDLPPGTYYFNLRKESGNVTKAVIKL